MNSSIVCNLEAHSILTAVVLKKVLRTSMNIVPTSSSPSTENCLSIKNYNSTDLISEYSRRYGSIDVAPSGTWSSEILTFVESIIEEKGETSTASILELCEAIVQGKSSVAPGIFSTLFSGFPFHIFRGSLSMLSEQRA